MTLATAEVGDRNQELHTLLVHLHDQFLLLEQEAHVTREALTAALKELGLPPIPGEYGIEAEQASP